MCIFKYKNEDLFSLRCRGTGILDLSLFDVETNEIVFHREFVIVLGMKFDPEFFHLLKEILNLVTIILWNHNRSFPPPQMELKKIKNGVAKKKK